jgi:hypothetical protein
VLVSMKGGSERASSLFPSDTTADAPTERAPVDCEVGANSRGINEPNWLGLAARDDREPRKRALVVFVLMKIESQPAAEADRRGKFWL